MRDGVKQTGWSRPRPSGGAHLQRGGPRPDPIEGPQVGLGHASMKRHLFSLEAPSRQRLGISLCCGPQPSAVLVADKYA